MTVPARLPVDVVTGHRAESRVDVLERAGQDVVDPRAAVGRRGALVEDPLRSPPPGLHALLEDPGPPPELEDPCLQPGEVDLRINRAIPRHPPLLSAFSRRDEAGTPRYHPAWRRLAAPPPHGSGSLRCHGRTRPALLRPTAVRTGGSGGMFEGPRRRASTVPGSLGARHALYSSPSSPLRRTIVSRPARGS